MNAVMKVPRVVVSREIAAPAEQLFDAWLDAESLAVWMRPGGTTHTSVSVDPRVGGTFEIIMHLSNKSIPHRGTYREISRPRRLVFTWNSPSAGETDSLVTVDFRPTHGATEVVITHEGLPSEEMVKAHAGGWTEILEILARSHI
jgi:uncharacterized protein YndB with AHSA1/START domain